MEEPLTLFLHVKNTANILDNPGKRHGEYFIQDDNIRILFFLDLFDTFDLHTYYKSKDHIQFQKRLLPCIQNTCTFFHPFITIRRILDPFGFIPRIGNLYQKRGELVLLGERTN